MKINPSFSSTQYLPPHPFTFTHIPSPFISRILLPSHLSNLHHTPKQFIHTPTMASLTSAAVTIPSFTGLKAAGPRATASATCVKAPGAFSVKASLKEAFGTALVAAAAGAVLASNALAAEVLLGSNDGGLAFVPSTLSVAPGETIVFKNNAGFPHNVVFDEDEVPAGVDAVAISMKEEDLLNAPGETYSVTLNEKGTYSFYCSPHQGAGMVGKVTVN